MTEHTAGPWQAYEWVDGDGTLWAVNADADYKLIGKVYKWADARLIAAAPELLAALEGLFYNPYIWEITYDETGGPAIRAAGAAIDKARGIAQ